MLKFTPHSTVGLGAGRGQKSAPNVREGVIHLYAGRRTPRRVAPGPGKLYPMHLAPRPHLRVEEWFLGISSTQTFKCHPRPTYSEYLRCGLWE